jgi:acyl-CoA synthetase (NDP forming)
MLENSMEYIFHPKSVAIVGASESVTRISGNYVHHLKNYGYRGKIYPINPNRSEIFGIKAYPDLKSITGNVDYVINCIALENTPELLKDCAQKGVRTIHILAGRGSETGHKEAIDLEQQILKQSREYGIRLIGPNCLGIYYPTEGLSIGWDLPKDSGNAGAVIQSGGNSLDLIRWGALRGLRFSKVISYGNALDLNECDFLEYLSHDPETKVILSYVEGVKDGLKYFHTLRQAAKRKPIVILKGGRTKSGNIAAASHTASLAGSYDIWCALIKQTGSIMAHNFEEWIDLGVAFSLIPPIKGKRLALTGGGGGQSVLGADECEETGFELNPLPSEIKEQIRKKAPIIWDWVGNPVDMSIMRDSGINNIEVLSMIANHTNFDLLIAQVTEDIPTSEEDFTARLRQEFEGYIAIFKSGVKPLIAVLGERGIGSNEMDNWRWRLLAEIRTRFIEAKMPFFPTVSRAVHALRRLINYYQNQS